jgi:hypothetical protein
MHNNVIGDRFTSDLDSKYDSFAVELFFLPNRYGTPLGRTSRYQYVFDFGARRDHERDTAQNLFPVPGRSVISQHSVPVLKSADRD